MTILHGHTMVNHVSNMVNIVLTMVKVLRKTGLIVPGKLTFPSFLTKQCGVVPCMVDRWHHLVPSLEVHS